jgi:RNA polymerase sigma factor (sigma-70 family)
MNAVVFEQQLQQDVIAAAGGDRAAFARLVDACRNTVCSIALAVTRDVASSEDIAQESFIAAWRNLPRLRNPSSFLPYLRQTTRNLANSHLRERIREPIDRGDFDLLIAASVDPMPEHSDRLIRREDEQALAEAIDTLAEEAREVITLFYREGQSVAQVASLLGLQEATVRKRLSRAREDIRSELLAHFARAAKASAPGAAFSALVMALLSTASPPVAAATAMGVAGAVGKSVAAKFAIGLSGAFAGAAFGIAGVVIGMRKAIERARDAQEKRDVWRVLWTSMSLVVVAALLLSPIGPEKHWWQPTLAFVGLSFGLGVIYLWWLPRVSTRSRAAELRENPEAWRRHRRERICGFLGWLVGTLTGGWGLYEGLRMSGLLP